jgi:hypothetical protein
VLSEKLTGDNSKVDSSLNKCGVVLHHLSEPVEKEVFLYKIARIVNVGRPNVAGW